MISDRHKVFKQKTVSRLATNLPVSVFFILLTAYMLFSNCFAVSAYGQTLGIHVNRLLTGLDKVFPTLEPYEGPHWRGGRISGIRAISSWPGFRLTIFGTKNSVTGFTMMCPLFENCFQEHQSDIVPLFIRLLDNTVPEWDRDSREAWIKRYLTHVKSRGDRIRFNDGCVGMQSLSDDVHRVGINRIEISTGLGFLLFGVYSPAFDQ